MITYFKSENNQICPIPGLEPGCWVNMIHPDEEEIASVSQALELDPAFLRAALDEEETSRIEVEDDVPGRMLCMFRNSLALAVPFLIG